MQNTTSSSVARFGFLGTVPAVCSSELQSPLPPSASVATVPFGTVPSPQNCSSLSSTSCPALAASAPLCFAPSTAAVAHLPGLPTTDNLSYNNSSGGEATNTNASALLTKLVNGETVGHHHTNSGQYKSLLPGFYHGGSPAAATRTNCNQRQLSSALNHQTNPATTSATSKLPQQTFNWQHSSPSPSSSASSIVKSARSLGQISSELAAAASAVQAVPSNWSSPLATVTGTSSSSPAANSSRISSSSSASSLLPQASLLPAIISSSATATAAAALQPASSLTFTRSRTKSLETPPATDCLAIRPSSPTSKHNGHSSISRATSQSSSASSGTLASRQVASQQHITSLKQPSFLATSSLHQLNTAATAAAAATTNASSSAIPMKVSTPAASSSSSTTTLVNGTSAANQLVQPTNQRLIKSQSLRFDCSQDGGPNGGLINGGANHFNTLAGSAKDYTGESPRIAATATTTVLAGSASFAGKLNGGSSKGSSVNASRTTTPTMSESEFGAGAAATGGSEEQALNSLGSDANSAGSLHKAVASKLTKTTISLAPASRLALKRTLPVNGGGTARLNATTSSLPQRKPLVGGSGRKNGDQLNATDHHLTPGVLGRNGSTTISRSPTYTRSLNAATTSKLAAGPRSGKVTSKAAPTASQLLSTKGAHRGLPATSFAKPTTSSTLKKSAATATTSTTASSAVSALKRASSPATSCSSSSYKRPSSVASNCSSVASSCYSAAAAISRQPKNGALRTPLSKRTTAAAAAGATKAIGTPAASSTSRRSSATSGASSKSGAFGSQFSGPTGSGSSSPHTAHKQTTTEQLRQYQALYWQQTETLKRYRLEHCRSTLQSTALLTVTAHLINEYSPFETPLLRRELHSLHAKCCKLNRDYELSKEAASQKEEIILRLEKRLWEQCQQLDAARADVAAATEKTAKLEAELAEGVSERSQLEEQAAGLRQQLEAEKEEHSSVLAKLTALEESCRSDRKYRDLKEKISTFQKEVDSLNVVLEMKAARNRNLETEQMRLQMELANYECLKETYQTLRRENEALSETVSLKARKNAEHAREIDSLRASLKKEVNERKRASIRGDQLEYKLNETIELLHTMSMSEAIGEEAFGEGSEEEKDAESGGVTNQQNSSFVPQYYSSVSKRSNGQPSQHYQHSQQRSTTNSRTAVRRLFSTPGSLVMPGGALPAGESSSSQQRAHFQHQEPQGGHHSHSHSHSNYHTHQHRSALPELVLSSIGASTGHWSSTNSGPSSAGSSSSSSGTAATTFSSVARSAGDNSNSGNSNGHSHQHQQQNQQHSSPPNSPKQGSRQLSSAGKEKEKAKTSSSAPPASTSPPSAVQVPTSTTTD